MKTAQWLMTQQPSSRSQDCPWHVRATKELLPLIKATGARTAVDLGSGEPPSMLKVMLEGQEIRITTLDLLACADVRADLGFLPFRENAFGIAIARHSLEHCPAPLLALREMARVATWSLVVVPEMAPIWQYWAGHFSVFPCLVWERLFQIAGLKIAFFNEGDFTEPNANARRIEWRWLLCRYNGAEGPYELNGHHLGRYALPSREGWQPGGYLLEEEE